MINNFLTTFFALLLIVFPVEALDKEYEITGLHAIMFETTMAQGYFEGLHGEVYFNAESLDNSKIDFKIDANSVKTGNTRTDEAIIGIEWLDADRFPYILFKSLEITVLDEQSIEKKYNIKGSLTIKSTTKIVDIPVVVKQTDHGKELDGELFINIDAFNIKSNNYAKMIG